MTSLDLVLCLSVQLDYAGSLRLSPNLPRPQLRHGAQQARQRAEVVAAPLAEVGRLGAEKALLLQRRDQALDGVVARDGRRLHVGDRLDDRR